MTDGVRALVPMAFVKSVESSIAFYRLLGFGVVNTFVPQGREGPTWASLRSGRAQLMIALASEPVVIEGAA